MLSMILPGGLSYISILFKLYINTKIKKVSVLLVSAILVGVVATGLYVMKRGSADGRMLIWKVSANMVKDKPIFGHGYDRFKANYLNYQADYFRGQGETEESIMAADTIRAFNEFIQLTSEDGIIGLLLILILIYFVFFNNRAVEAEKGQKSLVATFRAGILAFAVFACFSYPSEILPLKLSLVVCLAGISGQQKKVFVILKNVRILQGGLIFQYIRKGIALVGIAVVAWAVIPLTEAYNTSKIWKSAFVFYQMGNYDLSLIKYQQIYEQLKYNGLYLVNYGKACSMAGKHKLAIEILKRAEDFLPNSTLYTAMGDSYKATEKYKVAEQAYLKAADMLPDRFYAKYLLAKLYDETGQESKAIRIANKLLHKKAKIKSMAVDEIKKEMQIIINKSKIGSS